MKLRLFPKVLLILFISMLASMLVTLAYLRLTMGEMPPVPNFRVLFGLFPVPPLVSGFIVVVFTALGLAWYITAPMASLQRALREVANGNLAFRVLPAMKRRNDEIADVAKDFDAMAAQLEQLTQAQQRLLHDVSHELRSPLSRMQAAIGLLRQDASQADRMIERIERESVRMDALVEQLLTLHRLEGAPSVWPVDTVDVLDLLHAVAEDASFEARSKGREVLVDAQGSFVASVRGELLCRAFENVIRNAIKYTAAGTAVEVKAQVLGDELLVAVEDRGPGVAPESLEQMFEPFARLDESAEVRGVGLGLAITRSAIEMHGGKVAAKLREGGGLCVQMRLPRT